MGRGAGEGGAGSPARAVRQAPGAAVSPSRKGPFRGDRRPATRSGPPGRCPAHGRAPRRSTAASWSGRADPRTSSSAPPSRPAGRSAARPSNGSSHRNSPAAAPSSMTWASSAFHRWSRSPATSRRTGSRREAAQPSIHHRPALGLSRRRVPPQGRPQPPYGGGATGQQLAEMGEVRLGRVRESRRDQLLLGREVVEHQRVAHAQHRGHIGDPHGRDPTDLDLPDRRAQQVLPPLRHVQPDSSHRATLTNTPGQRGCDGVRRRCRRMRRTGILRTARTLHPA